MSLPLTRMMCVNVWLHVRTCSAHDVGRCFWQQCAHGSDIWTRKYTPVCGLSGILSDPGIQDFAEISTFPEKSGFVRNPGFPGFPRISGFRHFGGQTRLLAARPDFWLRRSDRTWDQVSGLPDGSADPEQICGSVRKSGNLVPGSETMASLCTYRPLSIPGSVENDWGRGGPFWRSPLTLALETIEFWKKIANHKNRQNCRKSDIFFLYPRKTSKKCHFFTSGKAKLPPVPIDVSHGSLTIFFDFFEVENSEIFALFFGLRKSQKIVSGHKIQKIALFRKSPDFRDFGRQTGFLRFA